MSNYVKDPHCYHQFGTFRNGGSSCEGRDPNYFTIDIFVLQSECWANAAPHWFGSVD